jgi:hypothetical protein
MINFSRKKKWLKDTASFLLAGKRDRKENFVLNAVKVSSIP